MTITDGLEEITISEFHDALLAGTYTVRDAVTWYLNRINKIDVDGAGLNSIVTVSQTALEEADRLDSHLAETGELLGPLHGVTVVVKDQIETAELATSFGSEAAADYHPANDATAIARLRQAGAIILAKTTLPDWATSWFSTSSRSGLTRNPYALDRDPGGSSSGTAAAVAANLSLVGIGEDTGGSSRLPASFCNLVGFRATPGLISRAGMSSLVVTQDTACPVTRTVTDAAILLDVMAGFDPADPYTSTALISAGTPDYASSAASGSLAGTRIGVLRQAFGDDSDPEGAEVNAVIGAALDKLAAAGATLVDISIDDLDHYVVYTSVYGSQSLRDMNEFLSTRADSGVESIDWIYQNKKYHPKLDLLELIAEGPSTPEGDPEYLGRVLAQAEFTRTTAAVFGELELDTIVFPDVRLPAPTHDDVMSDRWTCLTYPTNTVIASQLRFPAVSVPAGFTPQTDLPVGIELLGLPYRERDLLALAHATETALSGRRAPVIEE